MYHPWFVCYQIIYNFSPKKINNKTVYLTTLLMKPHDRKGTVYGGDSEGNFLYFIV